MIGVLALAFNIPQADAVVSTSYEVVSERPSGATYNDQSSLHSSSAMSGDGRYVVFESYDNDLVPGDTNGVIDVFVRDTVNDVTTRVSVSSGGVEGNAYSWRGAISYSGRYVVFESAANTLVSGITGTSTTHIYMHDLQSGTTSLVDTTSTGVVGNARAQSPKINADGRFVVFISSARNLDTSVTYAYPYALQVFVKDTHTGAVKILSATSSSVAGNKDSTMPDISCDGNIVAFTTGSTNLGSPVVPDGRLDLIVASIGWSGVELNNSITTTTSGMSPSATGSPQVSCDGNIILFVSGATNNVSPSTPSGYTNVYQYNRLTGSIVQASLGNGNVQQNSSGTGYVRAAMSGDGRYVAFTSSASNMDTTYPIGFDSGSNGSVYIRDMRNSTTELVTILPTNTRSSWSGSTAVSLNGNGSSIVFMHPIPGTSNPGRSLISGFTTGVYNGSNDIFKTQTGH